MPVATGGPMTGFAGGAHAKRRFAFVGPKFRGRLPLSVADPFCIAAIGLLCAFAYLDLLRGWDAFHARYLLACCLAALLVTALQSHSGGYSLARLAERDTVGRALGYWVMAFALMAAVLFLLELPGQFSRGWVILFFVFGALYFIASRAWLVGRIGRPS